MTVWGFVQLAINIFFLVGFFVVLKKTSRRREDDPRLSRGLQLLQSKISVLEDLSDRTDLQVKQLINLIEAKTRQLQTKIFESEKQIQRIDQSMHKSLEVADIFQDKIPHEEIIERQTSVKYIQAAQLAHQGKSVDDIVKLVGLSRGEVEFIAKVNKEELMFDETSLPAWAKKQVSQVEAQSDVDRLLSQSYEKAFEPPTADLSSLEQLGQEFREACKDYEDQQAKKEDVRFDIAPGVERAKVLSQKIVHSAEGLSSKVVSQAGELGAKMAQSSGAVTQKLANKTTDFFQEAALRVSELSNQIDENSETKELPKEPVLEFELSDTHNLSFKEGEQRKEEQSPIAAHQDKMFNFVNSASDDAEKDQGDLKNMSLSEVLDQPKKVEATEKKAPEVSEVKKVVFRNIDEVQ